LWQTERAVEALTFENRQAPGNCRHSGHRRLQGSHHRCDELHHYHANPAPAPAAATSAPATAGSTANRIIYPDPAQAKADLAAALRTAAQTHKRVLLDFGGNWCGDCQVLDIYFHNPQNLPVLESNFVLVHINHPIGARCLVFE
jgi:hypothetical protein